MDPTCVTAGSWYVHFRMRYKGTAPDRVFHKDRMVRQGPGFFAVVYRPGLGLRFHNLDDRMKEGKVPRLGHRFPHTTCMSAGVLMGRLWMGIAPLHSLSLWSCDHPLRVYAASVRQQDKETTVLFCQTEALQFHHSWGRRISILAKNLWCL